MPLQALLLVKRLALCKCWFMCLLRLPPAAVALTTMIMVVIGNPYQVPLVEILGKIYSNNLLVRGFVSTPPTQLTLAFQVIFNRRLHITGGRNPPDSDYTLYQSTPRFGRAGDTATSGMFHIRTGRDQDAINVHQEVWSDGVPLDSIDVGGISLPVTDDSFDAFFERKPQAVSKDGRGGLDYSLSAA